MSTTRSTSEPEGADPRGGSDLGHIPYTVIGGPRWDRVRRYPFGFTLLVMSRGDRLFRAELLRDLQGRRIGEVLWLEGGVPAPEVEALAREFPEVRFLLVAAPCSTGELVNIGIEESRSPLVLCMWSDTRLAPFPAAALDRIEKSGAICTVPVARTPRMEPIPSWQSPALRKRRFTVSFRIPQKDGEPTLFPFDYCGIYNKEKFAQSGGFDPAIASPYWQKLDFGMRSFLWGERLRGTTELALTYTGAPPEDDATPDQGYKLFWLKNVAVRERREMGVLPARRLFDYVAHSDTGPVYAIREFRAVRAWVHVHRFRFRRDPRELLTRWGSA
jgi:hypothetical protein